MYLLVPSIIPPPMDVTEGKSLDAVFKYSNVEYKQRDLLINAIIFWVIVVIARIGSVHLTKSYSLKTSYFFYD